MKVVSLTFLSSLLGFAFLCGFGAELYAQTTTPVTTQQSAQTVQAAAPKTAKPLERKFSRDSL
ncbi:MAG TPA: hypothetical protein PK002_15735, partial [Cellvibrio sp.]|nr:hypothetical protein [Cellvibrio sp.]